MLQKVDTKRLTAGLIVLTFLVIAVGGLIRVSDAGESCPDSVSYTHLRAHET